MRYIEQHVSVPPDNLQTEEIQHRERQNCKESKESGQHLRAVLRRRGLVVQNREAHGGREEEFGGGKAVIHATDDIFGDV